MMGCLNRRSMSLFQSNLFGIFMSSRMAIWKRAISTVEVEIPDVFETPFGCIPPDTGEANQETDTYWKLQNKAISGIKLGPRLVYSSGLSTLRGRRRRHRGSGQNFHYVIIVDQLYICQRPTLGDTSRPRQRGYRCRSAGLWADTWERGMVAGVRWTVSTPRAGVLLPPYAAMFEWCGRCEPFA